jgi:undecaprenyl diphosphate synthase
MPRSVRMNPQSSDPRGPVARHVAIIADGNRRWAYARGLPVSAGYEAGADTLKARLHDAIELGVKELTAYSFSTENWSRPASEIHQLISVLAARIEGETPELHGEGVRMRFIGRRDDAASQLSELMDWAELLTKANRRITLCIAFNYGGRAEILDAAKRFQGGTEDDFRRCLYASDLHDPDLIIRTGGEQRLSNYLLWQAAYSELAFREEMWPDFSREAFREAISHFGKRSRRFGGRAAEDPSTEPPDGAHRLQPLRVTTAVDNRSPR